MNILINFVYSGLTDGMAYLVDKSLKGASKKINKKIDGLFSKSKYWTIKTIYRKYSPWAISEKITHLAERGLAKDIESHFYLDLSQFLHGSFYSYFKSALDLGLRKIHVITDSCFIKEGLRAGRISDTFRLYPFEHSHYFLEGNNMVTCHIVDHRRLRGPFEKLFSLREIKRSLLPKLAEYICVENISPDLEDIEGLEGDFRQQAENHRDKISTEEERSSWYILNLANTHTIVMTQAFINRLLDQSPDYAEQILREWEKQFGFCDYANFLLFNNPQLVSQLICFIEGGRLDNQEITSCSLVHAVMLEGMRLYPVIPYLVRIAQEDFTLGRTLIKTNDVVVFNIIGHQRNQKVWGNPTSFQPKRFIDYEGKINQDLTRELLNFGYGSQQCLGRYLAQYNLLLTTTLYALKLAESKRRNDEFSNPKDSNTNPTYKITPPFLVIDSLLDQD